MQLVISDAHILDDDLDTERLGIELAAVTPLGGTWLLHGELGSGKTTVTRGIVAGLGGDPYDVSSPTYALAHRYKCNTGWIHHLDLYRLGDGEVWLLGLEDMVSPRDYLIVEWPTDFGPWANKWVADLTLNVIGDRRFASWTYKSSD